MQRTRCAFGCLVFDLLFGARNHLRHPQRNLVQSGLLFRIKLELLLLATLLRRLLLFRSGDLGSLGGILMIDGTSHSESILPQYCHSKSIQLGTGNR